MGNVLTKTRIYSASSIGDILRIARERASQEERRTKRYISEQLGMSVQRVSNIEASVSEIKLDEAIEWCNVLGDYTALEKIKHAYGIGLPATDPRLLESVQGQLLNFIQQAKQAIESAEELLEISTELRPGDSIQGELEHRILRQSEEILDTKHSSECVLASLNQNWGLCRDTLKKNWIQEAISDRVIVPSVSRFEEIRKDQFFRERFINL